MPVAPRIVNDVPYDLCHTLYCDFSWQAQHLAMSERHFLWQAKYLVKSGWIAGARNVVIFNTKCVAEWEKLRSANGRVQFCNLGRIILESSANVNDGSTVFGKLLLDFGMQFCVAGAIFGEAGG